MKKLLLAILLTSASTSVLAGQCKAVDSRTQAVDNYLDITRPMQWSSHGNIGDDGVVNVLMYVSAGSNEINPNEELMTINLTQQENGKWKCRI